MKDHLTPKGHDPQVEKLLYYIIYNNIVYMCIYIYCSVLYIVYIIFKKDYKKYIDMYYQATITKNIYRMIYSYKIINGLSRV